MDYIDMNSNMLNDYLSRTFIVKKYDDKGNLIYSENLKGEKRWYKNGNITHYKDNHGYEEWNDYDEYGILIYSKNSKGGEQWYDDNGNCIRQKESDGCEKWLDLDDKGDKIYE